jgi:hypothetical protein
MIISGASVVALASALSALSALLTLAAAAPGGTPRCPASPHDQHLPAVVGPGVGAHPLWVVDGSGGTWLGPDMPVKSLWILSREAPGPLHVRGQRLDGPGVLRFRRKGPIVGELSIPEPGAVSVIPGGASAAVVRSFAFVPSYLLYPSPGCWELNVTLGEHRRTIVIHMRAVPTMPEPEVSRPPERPAMWH